MISQSCDIILGMITQNSAEYMKSCMISYLMRFQMFYLHFFRFMEKHSHASKLVPRRRRGCSFDVLVHQELKGQPLSIRFAQTISSKFHHLAGQIRVEELGQPHFDVLKTPDAVGETPSDSDVMHSGPYLISVPVPGCRDKCILAVLKLSFTSNINQVYTTAHFEPFRSIILINSTTKQETPTNLLSRLRTTTRHIRKRIQQPLNHMASWAVELASPRRSEPLTNTTSLNFVISLSMIVISPSVMSMYIVILVLTIFCL